MIFKKETLKKLICEGKAQYTNGTEENSIVHNDGFDFVAVDRLDKMRTDHYEYLKEKQVLSSSQIGKLGGSKKTEAKSSSSRANGKLGGRPKKGREQQQDCFKGGDNVE